MIRVLERPVAPCLPRSTLTIKPYSVQEAIRWDAFVRQIGDDCNEGVVAFLQRRQGILVALEFVADAGHFGEHGRGVLALAFQHADLLRQAVAPGLQILRAYLQVLALAFQRLEGGGIERHATRGEAFGNEGGTAAKELNVQHGGSYVFFLAWRSSSRRCASFSAILCSRPRGVGLYHSTFGMPSGK